MSSKEDSDELSDELVERVNCSDKLTSTSVLTTVSSVELDKLNLTIDLKGEIHQSHQL